MIYGLVATIFMGSFAIGMITVGIYMLGVLFGL